MVESNLKEGIFDIPKDITLSKLFPNGFELVIKYKDGRTTRADFKSYKEARQAAERTTASDISKAFIIVRKNDSEKLSQLLNKPDSLILATVEKGKIDGSKINKVLQADKEAQAKAKEVKKQQIEDDRANKKLDKALNGNIVQDSAKVEEMPKTDKQELGIESKEAAKTEVPKETEQKPKEPKPEAEVPEAEESKPEAPAPEAKKPNRYQFTQADNAKSAVSRKVKIALAKIGVDVNSKEGQKKVQQVKDTLFGKQTTGKRKIDVGESYSYVKEGNNKMKTEKIKEEKELEENPFEYEDWDVDFEPRMDFDIDAPEFDGGFDDDDIDRTEVIVKAEVPAEAVENIPEDGKAKVELPVDDEADEEDSEKKPEENKESEEDKSEEKDKEESGIDVLKDKFDAKKVDDQLIISKKGEMDNLDSDKISVELTDDEFEALKKDFEGSIEGYDIDKMIEALNEADEDEVECQLCHEMLKKADAEKVDNIGYVCEACKEAINKNLKEDTHDRYAKPEGDRISAYNNALKYAKQENKPFIYGYTNRAGKFFAAETPMKVKGSPADAEKEFRSRYKNCNVLYVAYPDKDFIDENLKEDKKVDELPADPEAAKLEVHTMLNDLVADEIEAINGYDDAKAQIIDTPIEHKGSILDTIDHIKGEEQEHIDELIGATTEIPFDKEEANDLAAEEESLAEETHAQYAKPEGDRVAAYNNALKYAKKENKPFIYGYTNHTGKFFALNQPVKCADPTTKEDTKKFKNQYKNCTTVYIAYPDKEPIVK